MARPAQAVAGGEEPLLELPFSDQGAGHGLQRIMDEIQEFQTGTGVLALVLVSGISRGLADQPLARRGPPGGVMATVPEAGAPPRVSFNGHVRAAHGARVTYVRLTGMDDPRIKSRA